MTIGENSQIETTQRCVDGINCYEYDNKFFSRSFDSNFSRFAREWTKVGSQKIRYEDRDYEMWCSRAWRTFVVNANC